MPAVVAVLIAFVAIALVAIITVLQGTVVHTVPAIRIVEAARCPGILFVAPVRGRAMRQATAVPGIALSGTARICPCRYGKVPCTIVLATRIATAVDSPNNLFGRDLVVPPSVVDIVLPVGAEVKA